MKSNIFKIAALALVLPAIISSCKKGCTDSAANNYDAEAKKEDESCTYDPAIDPISDVNLQLYHMHGASTFSLGTDYSDDFGNTYQFTRAQLYLSSPTYMDDAMNVIATSAAYALVDPATSTYDFGTVPSGETVHTFSLNVGVDSTLNAADPAVSGVTYPALNYQTPSIHWNWNSGYIFIAIEGKVDLDASGTYDAGETFIMHVGSNQFLAENSGLISPFDPVAGVAQTIAMDLDWSKLLTGIDLATQNSTHTMDNMPLATSVSTNAQSILSMHM
jgi:hypothetical protein